MANNDFSYGVTTNDGNLVTCTNRVTGKSFQTEQLVIINGRLVRDPPPILAKGRNGCFYNPPLYHDDDGYRPLGKYADYYDASGAKKQEGIIPEPPDVIDPKRIVMPTLVSNAFGDDNPRYLKFVCFGADAMKMASAAKGSQIELIGYLDEFNFGGHQVKYLVAKELVYRPKGKEYR